MSIRSSIRMSNFDLEPFTSKSYSDLEIDYKMIDTEEFINEDPSNNMRKRLYKREFSIDGAKKIFKIFNKGKGYITLTQIRDFFNDFGFNVDADFSEIHNADIMLVYNIGGYLLPFREVCVKTLFKRSRFRNMLLSKLSPGVKRLHCRLYHNSDGCWYLTAHIDNANWMNIFSPIQLVISHFTKAAGLYEFGTQLMDVAFREVMENFSKKDLLFVDLNPIYEPMLQDRKKSMHL